ncbi:MAG: histidine phosphatase family protein [Allosphingosinicella sp.]
MRGRFFIARHGQTVFNAVGRMQGETVHTPLTRAGFAQAEAIGETLAARLGHAPRLELWSSTAGRALQTLAIAAEHLGLDWHAARIDARLAEMDMGRWGGRYHRDIEAEEGPFADRSRGMPLRRPPGGEWFDQVAARLSAWLEALDGTADRLVVMHGVSSRVLRGLLTGAEPDPACGVAVAPSLPQGSVVCIEDGVETLLRR